MKRQKKRDKINRTKDKKGIEYYRNKKMHEPTPRKRKMEPIVHEHGNLKKKEGKKYVNKEYNHEINNL